LNPSSHKITESTPKAIFHPHNYRKYHRTRIGLSEKPQFSAEDIYEIPAGVGRTDFEFDIRLLEVCHPLFQGCHDSREVLAVELVRVGLIRDSDMNLSAKNDLSVRWRKISAPVTR
jgi:hypothetical protein